MYCIIEEIFFIFINQRPMHTRCIILFKFVMKIVINVFCVNNDHQDFVLRKTGGTVFMKNVFVNKPFTIQVFILKFNAMCRSHHPFLAALNTSIQSCHLTYLLHFLKEYCKFFLVIKRIRLHVESMRNICSYHIINSICCVI